MLFSLPFLSFDFSFFVFFTIGGTSSDSKIDVYLSPISKLQVHEKEFLLKDLTTEGLLGGDRRLGEVCSKRVYRVLMAQNGAIKTDDVEDGADFFRC